MYMILKNGDHGKRSVTESQNRRDLSLDYIRARTSQEGVEREEAKVTQGSPQ